VEAQTMKEVSAEAFSSKLMKLTAEANKEFMKVGDVEAYLDENAEWLDKTMHTMIHGFARGLVNHIAGIQEVYDLKGFSSAAIIHQEYKNVLAGLLEDDSNFMIRLLAQRAALCWLHLQSAEYDRHRLNRCTGVRDYHINHAEKRITMAQGRFLRACAALNKARAMVAAIEVINERRGKTAKPRLALVAGMEA
jgi:hypothetical protein